MRALKVGDIALINGPLVTGRDAVHHYLLHHDSPTDLRGQILYHCGPVMMKENDRWRTTAAGPTTSIREEPYEAEIIERFGLRGVMGKGGMGKKTLEALQKFGAVYLHAIGGAAQFYARCLPRVSGVHLLEELGVPEAIRSTKTFGQRRARNWKKSALEAGRRCVSDRCRVLSRGSFGGYGLSFSGRDSS